MELPATEIYISNQAVHTGGNTQVLTIPYQTSVTLTDASWDVQRNAGWGVVLYQHTGELQKIEFGYIKAEDPFHAEALALLQTLTMQQELHNQQPKGIHVFSDCKQLVQAVNNNTVTDLPSWKAKETVAKCVQIVQSMRVWLTVRHAKREAMKGPHQLANWARRSHQSSGTPGYTRRDSEPVIDEHLSTEYFHFDNG